MPLDFNLKSVFGPQERKPSRQPRVAICSAALSQRWQQLCPEARAVSVINQTASPSQAGELASLFPLVHTVHMYTGWLTISRLWPQCVSD
jgi:hypothetical protein